MSHQPPQRLSPLGMPIPEQQFCRYEGCGQPVTTVCRRNRPCGCRVFPDFLICDECKIKHAGQPSQVPSMCPKCGVLNHIWLSPGEPFINGSLRHHLN